MHHAGVDTIGSRINKARRAAGITAAELARRAGLSGAYIGLVERDQRDPTVKVVAAIARALKINACQLAFGDLLDDPQDRP